MNIDLARNLVTQLDMALRPNVVAQTTDALRLAISESMPGDTIELVPGMVYKGLLTLPPKSSYVRITTRGVLPDGQVPTDLPLAVLDSGDLQETIRGTGAANWLIDGIAFNSRMDGLGEVIILQDAEHIIFSRIRLIAGEMGQKRGIRGNGKDITLTNSRIGNIWRTGQDSQAFCAWDGAGPYNITNNFIEAASENIMFGGSDAKSEDRIPSNILVEGNYFTKNPAWKPPIGQRTSGKAVKNLLELKAARHVVIRKNIFEGCWTDAQDGTAILIKSVNQNGTAPFTSTFDILFVENIIAETENGISIQGHDPEKPSGTTGDIRIVTNHVTCSGAAMKLGGEAGLVAVLQNEFFQGGNLLTLYSGTAITAGGYATTQLNYEGNKYRDVLYGIKGAGFASGEPSIKGYCKTYTYIGNIIQE